MISIDKALQIACEGKEQIDNDFVRDLLLEDNFKGEELNDNWKCVICHQAV